MAKKNETREHDFKKISKDIKAMKIANVVLLTGAEDYLINWASTAIVNKYISKDSMEFDFVKIEQENCTVDEIIGACETFSWFGGTRIVLVPDFLALSEKNKVKNFSESEQERLCEYVANMPENNILIFTINKVDKKKPLYSYIKKHGTVYEFNTLEDEDLEKFILKRFINANKICKPNVLKEIINLSGYKHRESEYTLYNLENDLRKVIAYSRSNEISLEDVKVSISGNLEKNVFEMIEAASNGRKDEAYRIVFNILLTGNLNDKIPPLLGTIVSQFEIILKVQELREEGKSLNDITKILGIHEYRAKRAFYFAERYSKDRLHKILINAYEVDINTKKGLLEQRLALEMLLARL